MQDLHFAARQRLRRSGCDHSRPAKGTCFALRVAVASNVSVARAVVEAVEACEPVHEPVSTGETTGGGPYADGKCLGGGGS